MKLTRKAVTTTVLALAACTCADAAFEMNIVGVVAPTVGTPDPGGSVVTPVNGAQAAFELSLYDTDTMATSSAYLTVTLDSFDPNVLKHSITTGQGNPDRVGILIDDDGTRNLRTATYTFSFYEDAAYTIPLSFDFVMQVSDIDETEQVSVSNSAFSGVTLSASTELEALSPATAGFIGLTNGDGENPIKTNPDAAANFESIANVSSFQVILGSTSKGFGSEFQFDFTPDIVVPEPSTYAFLLGAAALASVVLRRRRA